MKLRHRSLAVVLATCIAAPLVASTTAFAAPRDDLLTNHWGRLVLVDTTDNSYVAIDDDNSYVAIDDDLHGERETDLYEAEAEADFFDMPKAGKTSYFANNETGENIKADAGLPGGLGYADGSIADDEFNFEVEADGTVKTSTGKFVGFDDASGKLAATDTARYKFAGSALTENVSLVAALEEYDAEAGTALLSGTATPGALHDSQVKIGQTSAAVENDGTWVLFASDIAKGTKSLTVEQEVDGKPVDSHDVSLGDDGEVTPPEVVDATLTSPTQADSDAGTIKPGTVHFEGTATAGSHVELLLYTFGGRIVAEAETEDDGKWEADGVLGEGVYTLGMVQTPKVGEERRSETFPISTLPVSAYTNLSGVRPTADDIVRAGDVPLPFFGHGTPGAQVQIFNGPKDAVGWTPRALCGAPATVKADGTWYCRGLVARGTTYTLYTYQTKGSDSDMVLNTVQTGPDTIEPRISSANKGGGNVVFSGKATPDSKVEFYTSPKCTAGTREVASATTNEFGDFTSSVGWLSPGSPYTLSVYQTVDSKELPPSTFKVTSN